MDGVHYDDRDFFRDQQQEDRGKIWPLILAVGIHFVVFAASIWLPDILDRKPLLDDIVTVDLVSMPEPDMSTPAPVKPVTPSRQPEVKPPPKPTAPPPEPEPEPAELAVTPEPEIVPEPVAPVQPVSLVPRKRKIRKARDTRLAEEKEQEQRQKRAKLAEQKRKKEALAKKRKAEQKRKLAEKLRRKRAIAAARQAEREAELAAQEADRAAAAAREQLASVIRQKGTARTSGSSTGLKVDSVVVKQYLSSLYERVHGYWILPEMRKWDQSLETIVVLTIRRDGSVAGMQIERKSRDPYFDQFVMKTLKSAAPMPRFPSLMSQASIDIGFRFKPGELAM